MTKVEVRFDQHLVTLHGGWVTGVFPGPSHPSVQTLTRVPITGPAVCLHGLSWYLDLDLDLVQNPHRVWALDFSSHRITSREASSTLSRAALHEAADSVECTDCVHT